MAWYIFVHPLCFIGYFVTVTCWGEISLFALQHAPNTNDAVTASLFAFRQDRDLEMRFYSKKCTKQFTINALQRLHSLKEARFITCLVRLRQQVKILNWKPSLTCTALSHLCSVIWLNDISLMKHFVFNMMIRKHDICSEYWLNLQLSSTCNVTEICIYCQKWIIIFRSMNILLKISIMTLRWVNHV